MDEKMKELSQVLPSEIEARSFEIITEELGERTFPEKEAPIVKRVIHTTADFEYADSLVFSPGAVDKALEALKNGACIVTDTNMGKSGINKRALEQSAYDVMINSVPAKDVILASEYEVYCFMADEDVAKKAAASGTTRAVASMDKAAEMGKDCIFAVGKAPTALVRLYELIQEGKIHPKLIIGVPVGFVNVVPSKELIISLPDTPYIVARGRKGGSNVAAAICNALIYQLTRK